MSEHKEYVIINKYMPETGHGEKLTIGKWKTKQMILTSEKKRKLVQEERCGCNALCGTVNKYIVSII